MVSISASAMRVKYLAPGSVPLASMLLDEIRRCDTRTSRLEYLHTSPAAKASSEEPVTHLRRSQRLNSILGIALNLLGHGNQFVVWYQVVDGLLASQSSVTHCVSFAGISCPSRMGALAY